MFVIRSPVSVLARAMMSGTGEADADSSSVLMPGSGGTARVLAPPKASCTSVAPNAADGVSEMT